MSVNLSQLDKKLHRFHKIFPEVFLYHLIVKVFVLAVDSDFSCRDSYQFPFISFIIGIVNQLNIFA